MWTLKLMPYFFIIPISIYQQFLAKNIAYTFIQREEIANSKDKPISLSRKIFLTAYTSLALQK